MDWSNYDSSKFAWLNDRAYNLFTQEGADGLLEAIFERIGETNRFCCEFGAADGLWFSNTRRLIEQGWGSLLIEGDPVSYVKLEARYADSPHVSTENAWVTPHGINSLDNLLERAGAPSDLDLLVIDIDGADYYVFNALARHRPRVIVCEYDQRVDPMFIPELNGPGQAGEKAIVHVANARGYLPVCKTAYNLFFVRADLIDYVAESVPPPPVNGFHPNFAAPASAKDDGLVRLCAVMTTPRIGFLSTMDCVFSTMAQVSSAFVRTEGVFWGQNLTRAIESALERGANYILAIDFDSLFHVDDVKRLVCHLYDNPEVDIAVSLQMKRENGGLLLSSDGEVDLRQPLAPILQGHFGLTMMRASAFERLSKPWFAEVPDEQGGWGEGRLDGDVYFWKNCRDHNLQLRAALDVVIGHIEQVATWPNQALQPFYQTLSDWRKDGKPLEAFIKPPIDAPEPRALVAVMSD